VKPTISNQLKFAQDKTMLFRHNLASVNFLTIADVFEMGCCINSQRNPGTTDAAIFDITRSTSRITLASISPSKMLV
jgi:hypothetical protein